MRVEGVQSWLGFWTIRGSLLKYSTIIKNLLFSKNPVKTGHKKSTLTYFIIRMSKKAGEELERGDRAILVVRFGTTNAIEASPPLLQVEHAKKVCFKIVK